MSHSPDLSPTDALAAALSNLDAAMTDRSVRKPLEYEEFLRELSSRPTALLRNVFQIFHDMILWYLGAGTEEYPNDPESIHFLSYDCSRLFECETDRPFFADRLFANRLVSLAECIQRGTQQNKIYIFNGPPGCGKSTFLDNLLRKFQAFSNTEEGMRYEVLWRLDPVKLRGTGEPVPFPLLDQLAALLGKDQEQVLGKLRTHISGRMHPDDIIEIPCPSHDHPILMVPKRLREAFLSDLLRDSPFRQVLFSAKEYHWVWRDKPCTFCSSLYRTLLTKLGSPAKVHAMLFARHYRFNRRLGEGITVFNPGDPSPNRIVENTSTQDRLSALLRAADVQYVCSRYAKTNNGIYALMDVKSHNTDRFIELHNIISEGVHKVDNLEESVNSLLLAIMNPEDQKNIKEFKSFSDRIEYINVPYVMDVNTEVKIYRFTFGKHIDEGFLPRVLDNFARIIISSRLATRSEALLEWIGDPQKYGLYCDRNLQLLKMEIYSGVIPAWLSEEDRRALTAARRRKIIAESEREGIRGISGRDSIGIFSEFYSTYARNGKLITMSMLREFFTKRKGELLESIPSGFLDSLLRMYNYTVLQEVKESLFYYNEDQISRDILNYLFAINFEPPTVERCTFTGDKLTISEDFLHSIEARFLGTRTERRERWMFREGVQREYTTRTLTQEILLEEKEPSRTELFGQLRERYVQNLKEKALDPFLDNGNFRRAIKDYGTDDFKAYDKRIREDVGFLIGNLQGKFGYTEQGAREVCTYVIDSDLARAFG